MLSEREREILSRVFQSNKDIGKSLYIAVCTVKTHFARMTARFKATSRFDLFAKALKSGDIKRIDLGFWDENGKYHEDWYTVDLRKE